jgi:hypothetical protein
VPSAPRLLRYRFDSIAQARCHVHLVEGRQLLFIADPFAELRERERLLISICFTGSEETATAPSEVCSLETGRLRGAWVELFPSRILDELAVALRNQPRRKHRRMPADGMVRVQRGGRPVAMARIADISGGGARLVGAGNAWARGEQVEVAPLGAGKPLSARVAWSRGGEVAVEFARSDASTRIAVVKMMQSAAARWSEAREVTHPSLCRCDHGGPVLEPVLPRAPRRAEVV